MDRILAVLPVYNRKKASLNCLSQLDELDKEGYKLDIFVIDDGSNDGTSDAIKSDYPDAVVIRGSGDLWWGGAVNIGFQYALKHAHDFVYLLNDDIDIMPHETLLNLYMTLKDNRNAVCSSVFLKENDQIFFAGYRIEGRLKKMINQLRGINIHLRPSELIEADSLSSRSVLVPTDIIRHVGLFDTKHFPHNYSDTDYFVRVKKQGYSLIVNLNSRIYSGGSDTNYHSLISNKDIKEIIKSFFHVKYGNNIKKTYYSSILGESALMGHFLFVRKMAGYTAWLILRLILTKNKLQMLLRSTGRV